MSRAARDQYDRSYHVSETRTNPKGFTEYKVIAEFIPKKNPQDVKEIVVWKRYSDFKKLHGELSYTHRNLFQRTQEFPAFPRAQVFGRFEPPVIEERRQAAEEMLRFTVTIPALNNSPQLKEFFRTGEATVRSDGPESADVLVLPPPLVPEPVRSSSLEAKEEENGADVTPSEYAEDSVSNEPTAFDLLFDLSEELCPIEAEKTHNELPSTNTLTPIDLALFDPCYTEDGASVEPESSLNNLLSLSCEVQELTLGHSVGEEEEVSYISEATSEVQRALERETAGDYPESFRLFRNAVDILLKGVKDDPCQDRRDAVTRRTAEYLHHAEKIFQDHISDQSDQSTK